MDKVVYGLCILTSGACALLLARGYRRTGLRLLYWSSVCFACLLASNLLVYADIVLFPEIDLVPLRNGVTLLGLVALVFGMIEEAV